MDTRGFFSGIKRPGRETDHSPPSRAEVKNVGGVPQVSHTSSLLEENSSQKKNKYYSIQLFYK
jgi:hypothetical protein